MLYLQCQACVEQFFSTYSHLIEHYPLGIKKQTFSGAHGVFWDRNWDVQCPNNITGANHLRPSLQQRKCTHSHLMDVKDLLCTY